MSADRTRRSAHGSRPSESNMTIETFSRCVTLPDGDGLHLRAAAALAHVASEFQSDIWVRKNGRKADAKSIMDLLSLAAEPRTEIIFEVNGPDSRMAINAVANLVLGGFRNSFERSDARNPKRIHNDQMFETPGVATFGPPFGS